MVIYTMLEWWLLHIVMGLLMKRRDWSLDTKSGPVRSSRKQGRRTPPWEASGRDRDPRSSVKVVWVTLASGKS
jgi:hypothetical protein